MKVLANKVVVITGGTRGFGLATARACMEAGASVVVASRSEQSVDRALTELQSVADGEARGLLCDVGDLAQVEALRDYVLATLGRLDVWVNNAGISGPYGPTAHILPEAFHTVVQTNVFGTYHGSLVAVQHFLRRDAGKLINILGRGERMPAPMQAAYASSKAWVRSFTIALAKEYKHTGVGIYAFNPGMMTTDLLTRLHVVQGYEDTLNAFPTIVRMWAKPPEVPAEKIVWLASADTDERTGLLVRESTPWSMLMGAAREGLRRLLGRTEPPLEMDVEAVPSAMDEI